MNEAQMRRLIRDARNQAFEEAAQIAAPERHHRKPGAWVRQRIAIADKIRTCVSEYESAQGEGATACPR